MKKHYCDSFNRLVIGNRVGKFAITNALLEVSLDEHLYATGVIQYEAYSDLFEPIPPDAIIPGYKFIFHRNANGETELKEVVRTDTLISSERVP